MALIPTEPANITVPSSSYNASFGVSWSASAHTTNYVLQRSVNGGSWGTVHTGTATSTTVTVSASGTYRFRVSACGAGGCSAYRVSGNVAVTLRPATAPHLSGPSSSISGTFTLTWTGVSGATRYQLNQTLSGHLTSPYNAGGKSWSSSQFGNGTYAYQVFACNAAGCGPGSNLVSVKVLHIPPAPSIMYAPQQVPYPGNPWLLEWTASSGATSYTPRRTNVDLGIVVTLYPTSDTEENDYIPGGTYQYAVKACNASGCSAWKNAGHQTIVYCPNQGGGGGGGGGRGNVVHPDMTSCNEGNVRAASAGTSP